jgi:hypothetical protein
MLWVKFQANWPRRWGVVVAKVNQGHGVEDTPLGDAQHLEWHRRHDVELNFTERCGTARNGPSRATWQPRF